MTKLIVTWTLFTIAITINQVTARDFVNQALKNLLKHQSQHEQDNNQRGDSDHAVNLNPFLSSYSVGPALYLGNFNGALNQKHIQQRDDSDDESSLQHLRKLIELALGNEAIKKDKNVKRKKQHNKSSQLGSLNAINLDSVLLQNSVQQKRKPKSVLDVLGASKTRKPAPDEDSQAFVILDADALQGGSDDSLNVNDLLSALDKLSSPSLKDRSVLQPEYRYKGFRVKVPRGSYRKARGDSNEKYASADDDEITRPLKRPRAYVGKGRTAIPYIKNRGDIYEKDY